MGTSFVSPGVYVQERDFSQFVPSLSATIVGMIGTATRGPVLTPTLVTDMNSLAANFGVFNTNHLAIYAASQYLQAGRQLIFVRVGHSGTAASDLASAAVTLQDTVPSNTLTVTANTQGSWANYGTNSNNRPVGVQIQITTASLGSSGYKLNVLYQNALVESYDNLSNASSPPTGFTSPTTAINSVSSYITVAKLLTTNPVAGTFSMAGGADGYQNLSNSDVIAGINLLQNPDQYNINVLCVPGNSNDSVISQILTVAQNRTDCIGLIDPPLGLGTVQAAVDFSNGTGSYTGHSQLNSSYGSLYWPWVQIFDDFNNLDVYIPPSSFACYAYAYTDANFDPWYAPAGLTRGRILNGLATEVALTQGDRDYLYTQNVNPIYNMPGQGIVIWGQKTLYRTPSALDRVNVRRLLIYTEKAIAAATRFLVFEPNNPRTWRAFINLVTPFLTSIQAANGITSFSIVCDATTNTPSVIENNQMVGQLWIKPTLTAEMITLQFIVTDQSVVFSTT